MPEFTGKVALVTGASRGIGKSIAEELAKNGAHVVINYLGNKALAEEAVEAIKIHGNKALAIKCDITSETEVAAMMKQIVASLGTINLLVNNAGITKDTLLLRMKEVDWDTVINTNLKGTFLCTKAAVRHMLKNKEGSIVNVASIVGVSGNAGQANYVAAKSGVIGFTKTVALELASKGITVNAVAPGFITTDMTEKLPADIKDKMLSKIPLNRFGEAADVAKTVSFLLSAQTSYITGQTINIDGGLVM